MIIAIHQPNYLPYLGFFDKIRKADLFVIYDDAQFNKEDFQHRNKIRIYHGWKWLTVPVVKKHIPIKDIIIKKDITWRDLHMREIKDNYINTPCYNLYSEHLNAIYMNKYNKLIDLNMNIINFLKNAFDIKTKMIFASELDFASKSTERLVDITEALGGDVYLSGPAGLKYLDISLFEDRGIKVEFQDFKHPVYNQRYKGYISNMSAIDALFNVGEMPKTED